jgi:cytochrome c556
LDLFLPGSDVPDSKIKPEIFAANDQVERLIAEVKKAAAQLVPAAETGDEAKIAAAYAALNNACNACHKEFRKEE